MPRIRKRPFVEKLVIDYLEADVDLAALVGGPGDGARVSTELPRGFTAASPSRLQVFDATSAELDPETHYLDRTVLQLNAYAPTRQTAYAVMAEALRALLEAPNAAHAAAVVTAAERVTGPRWDPDTSMAPAGPRYVASVAWTVHPTA